MIRRWVSGSSRAGPPDATMVNLPMGTLPDGMPTGMQLVGRPGADLRLLELAGIGAATLDAAPPYPARV